MGDGETIVIDGLYDGFYADYGGSDAGFCKAELNCHMCVVCGVRSLLLYYCS